MSLIEGKYKNFKNENIDEYFAACGIPYIVRKMIVMSSPTLEITKKDETWTVKLITLMRTYEQIFKLDEEYDEQMPDVTLKNIATMKGENELLITSTVPDTGEKTTRCYVFTDEECVLTLIHPKAKSPAKRYFRRIKQD